VRVRVRVTLTTLTWKKVRPDSSCRNMSAGFMWPVRPNSPASAPLRAEGEGAA